MKGQIGKRNEKKKICFYERPPAIFANHYSPGTVKKKNIKYTSVAIQFPGFEEILTSPVSFVLFFFFFLNA